MQGNYHAQNWFHFFRFTMVSRLLKNSLVENTLKSKNHIIMLLMKWDNNSLSWSTSGSPPWVPWNLVWKKKFINLSPSKYCWRQKYYFVLMLDIWCTYIDIHGLYRIIYYKKRISFPVNRWADKLYQVIVIIY